MLLVLLLAGFAGQVVAGPEPSVTNEPLVCESINARDSLLQSAKALTANGRSRLALLALDQAQREEPQFRAHPSWGVRRATVLLDIGENAQALALLDELQRAAVVQTGNTGATFHNAYGRAHAATGNLSEAVVHFDRSAAAGTGDLRIRATLNGLRARIEANDLLGLEGHLHAAAEMLSQERVGSVMPIQLAELIHHAVQKLALSDSLLVQAQRLIERVESQILEKAIGGRDALVTLAQIAGMQGAMAETSGDVELAIARTDRALEQAKSASALSQVFRWQWQRARLARTVGDNVVALKALREAVFLLENFRQSVTPGGSDSYQNLVEPVYRAYADLLLIDSTGLAGEADQGELRSVRRLLESLKKAEVEDYFASRCLTTEGGQEQVVTQGQAILYPIVFKDRLELLLEVDSDLQRVSIPIEEVTLVREIRAFRLNLERARSGDDYLEQAKKLYGWLIAPLHDDLSRNQIDTLIVVPDGALRTIPFAALHSGRRFLIEEFAIATTPAIGLTDTGVQSAVAEGDILAGGLTQSVQGYSELPGAGVEMSALVEEFNAEEIRDTEFQLANVSKGLRATEFNVVHLATHGEFSADHNDSFLLTFDGRLRLPTLKGLLDTRTNKKLDLLVLSACQSAAGDDQAALGLAGVAVQSGARSAVASLWSINDASTAELFDVFYGELRNNRASKAESLRRAQLSLLRDQRFAHPSYWAPFLLIGQVL